MPCETRSFVRWLFALIVMTLTATSAGAANRKPLLDELIFDRAAFLQSLPRKVLVTPRQPNAPDRVPDDSALLETALAKLGRAEAVEFLRFPDDARQPRVIHSVPPVYPIDLVRNRVEGEAMFLVFINATGRVGALYCCAQTNKRLAAAAAAAIVQWQFRPAELQRTKVPVLAPILISFSLR